MVRSTPLRVLILLLSCTLLSSALADEYQHRIEFYQKTSDGKTSACGINHTVVFKDETYDLTIGGASIFIEFLGNARKFFAFFKISEGSFLRGISAPATQEPIANASVFFEGRSVPLTRSACQNDTKSFCGGIGGDDAGYLANAIALPGARLRFNRYIGSIDYDFDLSLKSNKTMSNNDKFSLENDALGHLHCLVGIWSGK